MTVKRPTAGAPIINRDTLTWSNPFGGDSGVAANWMDVNTGTIAAAGPGINNAVSITGGVGNFTNLNGTSTVAQLTVTNDVILWGKETVGGSIILASNSAYPGTNLGLDGGAVVTASSLSVQASSTLETAAASKLTISGTATFSGGYLSAADGSTVRLGGLITNNGGYGNTLAVDANSSLEIGSAGSAALGAITIDKTQSIAFAGILAGNVVVNGTVNVPGGGSLKMGGGQSANGTMGAPRTVSGSGVIRLSEGSILTLDAADSAAIQFTGPAGVLILDQFGQTGTVSGFAATDVIETGPGLATGVSAAATSSATKLTFANGGKPVGTLTLSGNYIGSLFHFSRNASGYGTVTLQTIGSAPVVPTLILGTASSDILTATANNQTLTGLGGNDSLAAGKFTGVTFKDASVNLNGSTIQAFGATDFIDLTDMAPAKASATYASGGLPSYPYPFPTLLIADGTHTATITLAALASLPTGYFATSSDSGTGTTVKYVTVTPDVYRFANQAGGVYSVAGNWMDITTGATATVPPTPDSSVAIAGNPTGLTTITGSGVAASLTTTGNVMIRGSITVPNLLNSTTVGGATLTQSGTLTLDSGASVALAAAGSVMVSGTLNLSRASKLTTAGSLAFTANGAALQVTGTSTAQFSALGGAANNSYSATIGVDATSSVEFGTTGSAQQGALTVDTGVTANFFGAINGNVVLSGTLIEAGSTLSIGGFNSANAAITGTGTLAFGGSNQTLRLTGTDRAAIQFSSADMLILGSILPTGTISGFGFSDTIAIGQAVSSVQYSSSGPGGGTLTLLNGSAVVGKLAFAGTYTTNQFLVQSNGKSTTLAYVPPPILGTPGFDTLMATANNETLTGLGGNDLLAAGGFTGLTFKDSSVNLNGSTIQTFDMTDVIDLTDMAPATATLLYTPAVIVGPPPTYLGTPASITVTDGTHTARVILTALGNLPVGYFAAASDGGSGTILKYVTVKTDSFSFASPLGGSYSATASWTDTTTGGTAATPPGAGNNVAIAGVATGYTNITGNGVAANLTTTGDVLIWGSIAVASLVGASSGALNQSGTLTLDGGASLILPPTGSSTAGALIGGTVELTGGSNLIAAGGLAFTQNGAALQVTGSSAAKLSSLQAASPGGPGAFCYAATIGVDVTSSIEIGTAGAAQKGAVTVDAGVSANFCGAINGNIVLNGTLTEAGASLSLAGFGTANASITGTGTLAFGGVGESLQLTGSDSAAIWFAGANDLLALGTILPAGTISGFGIGDSISVATSVTGLTYGQSTGGGTLTLLNGSSTVGTLTFSGTYSANQFQLQLGANGQSSTIAYLPTPSTTSGNQVSVNSDAYTWSATAGGDWTNPANWSDAGAVPLAAPGSGNAVTFGRGGLISGSGSAASLSAGPIGGPLVFTGTVNVIGKLYQAGGFVGLTSGAKFTAASLTDYGTLQIAAGSSLIITGSASQNNVLTFINGTLDVIGGSSVNISSADYVVGNITVDGASRFEFGSTGDAAVGALTIDAGTSISFSTETIAANMVVAGTASVSNVTIEGFAGTAGSISGTGTLALGYNGHLTLDAADSATIAFWPSQNHGTLEIGGPLPTGLLVGFTAGDVIQVDQTVTGISFTQTAPTQGTLTLLNGTMIVGTLTLAGDYTSDMFHVDVAAATGFASISVQTQPSNAGGGTSSTNMDAYSWVGTGVGGWSAASSWMDTTTNAIPLQAPGTGNAVTIAGSSPITIGGNGTAASLTDSGNLQLTGTISLAGQLTVNAQSRQPAGLTLDAGAQLTAASAMIIGRLQAGGASSATVSGTATVTTGTVLALAASTLQFGGLIGSNDIIAVDASSSIVVGAAGSPSVGTLTLAAGSTVALSGSIYGNVVANSLLSVAGGGALSIDMNGNAEFDPYGTNPAITGTGTLSLAENSSLSLGVIDSAAIQFAGPNATLVLAAMPTATISGFVTGDQIEVDQPVTGLTYVQTSQNAATLTLTNGTATVGTLKLAGNYASTGGAFHLESTGNGSTAAITRQSLGPAPTQPTLIQGTAAADILTATANGQTLTALGGGDTLNGAGFTGIDFKDLTGNLSGSVIQNFAATDILDFTDMKSSAAAVSYSGGMLTVGDGTVSASVVIGNFSSTGAFHATSDGVSGTKLSWS